MEAGVEARVEAAPESTGAAMGPAGSPSRAMPPPHILQKRASVVF
jgi:hypothetical protein